LFSNGLNGFCGERKQMSRCGHQPCTPVAPQLHPAPLNSRKRGHKSLRPRGYRRASFAARSPSSDLWLHEIKHDGFRVIARKQSKPVRLYSRPGNDLTRRFPGTTLGWKC
jgi:bifunctional non-homologous end joining protein LigD